MVERWRRYARKVAQHYGEEEEGLERFILISAEENREKPIGYFQHYRVNEDLIGIDQLIGEEDYINRGVGTTAIRMFVEKIVQEHRPPPDCSRPFAG